MKDGGMARMVAAKMANNNNNSSADELAPRIPALLLLGKMKALASEGSAGIVALGSRIGKTLGEGRSSPTKTPTPPVPVPPEKKDDDIAKPLLYVAPIEPHKEPDIAKPVIAVAPPPATLLEPCDAATVAEKVGVATKSPETPEPAAAATLPLEEVPSPKASTQEPPNTNENGDEKKQEARETVELCTACLRSSRGNKSSDDSYPIRTQKLSPELSIKYRIVVVGSSSVGKTSIMRRYLYGMPPDAQKPTLGFDVLYHRVRLGEDSYLLELRDTSGAEQFQSLLPYAIKSVDAAVVVFSVDSRDSAENVGPWYKLVKQCASDSLLWFVVANKADLLTSESAEFKYYASVLEKGIRIASEYSIPNCMCTSAVNGQGIDALFYTIASALHERENRFQDLSVTSVAAGESSCALRQATSITVADAMAMRVAKRCQIVVHPSGSMSVPGPPSTALSPIGGSDNNLRHRRRYAGDEETMEDREKLERRAYARIIVREQGMYSFCTIS